MVYTTSKDVFVTFCWWWRQLHVSGSGQLSGRGSVPVVRLVVTVRLCLLGRFPCDHYLGLFKRFCLGTPSWPNLRILVFRLNGLLVFCLKLRLLGWLWHSTSAEFAPSFTCTFLVGTGSFASSKAKIVSRSSPNPDAFFFLHQLFSFCWVLTATPKNAKHHRATRKAVQPTRYFHQFSTGMTKHNKYNLKLNPLGWTIKWNE